MTDSPPPTMSADTIGMCSPQELAIASIVENGPRWNKEWLQRPATSGHFLAVAWEILHHRSDEFVTTSCEITAEAIRWRLGVEDPSLWSLLSEARPFADIRREFPFFQVSIGDCWESCEHVLTIWNDHVIQSYFGHYPCRATPITDTLSAAFDRIRAHGSYQLITETATEVPADMDMNVYFWIPKPN